MNGLLNIHGYIHIYEKFKVFGFEVVLLFRKKGSIATNHANLNYMQPYVSLLEMAVS